jgi:hypothetical protein
MFRAGQISAAFHFVPLEQWKEMGEVLHDTFPEGTPFFVSANAQYLGGYLAAGYSPARDVAVPDFARGRMLYLDTPIVDPPGGRVDARRFVPNAVEFRIPQRRAGYESLWFCPPERSHVIAVRSAGRGDLRGAVTDRDLGTGTGRLSVSPGMSPWLEVELERGARYRSLVVISEASADIAVSTLSADRTAAARLSQVRSWQQTTLVSLEDREVEVVTLTGNRPDGMTAVQEVWAYVATSR